jgi:uncharacterized protein (UPF0332 family)
MSVQPSDFSQIATTLANGSTEIEWRVSASRAYYASFHTAQAAVDLCPNNNHLSMGSHERITDRFLLHGVNSAKSISYMLQAMKKIRHIADYEIEDAFQKELAIKQISSMEGLNLKLIEFDRTYRLSA